MSILDGLDRDQLVCDHLDLVRRAAGAAIRRMPLHVRHEDLVSAGAEALCQAARSFEQGRGVPFEGYATIRVKGAILDELRSHDWASRSVRVQQRRHDQATAELAVKLRRHPTEGEIAHHLGVSVAKVRAVRADVHAAETLRLDWVDFFDDDGPADRWPRQDHEPSCEDIVIGREQVGYLFDAVAALSPNERLVITRFYFQGSDQYAIGDELGVTASRVSQIRNEACIHIREALTALTDPEVATPALSARKERRRRAYWRSVQQRGTVSSRIRAGAGGEAA